MNPGKPLTAYPEILHGSSKTTLPAEDTIHLLEKTNALIKEVGGSLTISINAAACEVRYAGPNGALICIGDNQWAPSDMLADIAGRLQELHKTIQQIELKRAEKEKETLKKVEEATKTSFTH